MTSAALVDLSNRINTNTLTAAQQALLVQALAVIAPLMPGPDELAAGIPANEGYLAREWFAPLYALEAEGASTLPNTLAHEWARNPAQVNVTNASQVAASVAITPNVSGKIAVRITGVAQNQDSGTVHNVTVGISVTTPALGALFSAAPVRMPVQTGGTSAGNGTAAFALIVELDKLPAPQILTPGVAATINATIISDSANQTLLQAQALQIEAVELP